MATRLATYSLSLCFMLFLFIAPMKAWAIGDFGPDTCAEGFVWREACGPADHVCVTPDIRAQARDDNAQAAARRQPGGGPFGPDTCLQGFVWREACGPNDHVCVPPSTRSRAAEDNQHAGARLKYPICRQYAQDAIDANRQNVERGCGFSGPRWQDNFDAHFHWCLNVDANAPRNEASARNQQLAQCASQPHWTCAHCNDGSCQCGNMTGPQLCAGHGGDDPSIGCIQQQ